MNIRNEIAELFRMAIADPRNSSEGYVIVDRVSADILIALYIPRLREQLGPIEGFSLEEFDKIFDSLVDLELALEAA